MPSLPLEQIQTYRRKTFRIEPHLRLKTKEQAVEFVNERKFIHFWPIQGALLPSLWAATVGDRPVPNDHDDPGHITWGWKDELLDKKVWYYARLLKKRNSFISLEFVPNFYALSPNFGDPENDYIDQYQAGLMTLETKLVYEALLEDGPLDTISLRKAARLSNPESTSRFNRALDTLQYEFKALPVGIAAAGAWKYAFIYDLTHRYYPDLLERAHPISEWQARQNILREYLRSVGAASMRDIQRLFAWRLEDTQRAVHQLVEEKVVNDKLEIESLPGEFVVLTELLK
jgi:hypothetical protein